MSLLYVLHGVDAHFDLVSPPVGTVSFWVGSILGIGCSMPAGGSLAAEATSLVLPVTMLSATIAWSAFTVTCLH